MTTREGFRNLSKKRLKAAKILYDNEDYEGAIYLLVYVVEFALKAVICRNLKLEEYPQSDRYKEIFKQHDFEKLLIISGMHREMHDDPTTPLALNWAKVTKHKVESRYDEIGTYTKGDVEEILEALSQPGHGFITWIMKHKKW